MLRDASPSTAVLPRTAVRLPSATSQIFRPCTIGGSISKGSRIRPRQLDCFAAFSERRAPEVGFNGVVLHRELKALGFSGGLMQVQRFVRPYREQRRW